MKDTIIAYLQSRPVLFVQRATLTAKQAADTVDWCKDNGVQFLYIKQADGNVLALFGQTIAWLSGSVINSVEEGVGLVTRNWPDDEGLVQASMHCLPQ